jgi:hypothetical protein
VTGKPAFAKQIEPDAITGNPAITVSRMTEEHNVVVTEGSIRTTIFCDVFVMQGAKIKHLTAYLMELTDESPK